MNRTVLETDKAPSAIGPYSQAVKAGGFLFVSGQLPMDAKTGEIVPGDAASQARKALENMRGILEEASLTMADVVKVTICLTNMGDFTSVNEVYATFFNNEPPARICYEVSTLPKNVNVEMDCIAVLSASE